MSRYQKWLQKIPGVMTFLMVIALGATLANLLWMILTPPTAIAQAANLKKVDIAANNAKSANYGKLIADQHIFGAIPKKKPKQVKAPPPKPVKKKPVAKKLNLTLHGIIASKSSEGGFALLSYNRKAQEVYKLGELIPKLQEGEERKLDGVSLKYIGDNHVLIDNNGTEQKVELPKFDLASNSDTKSNQRPQRSTNRLRPRARTVATRAPQAEPASNSSANGGDSSQPKTLAELRDQALNDPSIVMSVITPSIVRKDGAVTGIRVYPSQNRKLFRELGLRNGDIITQVNDIIIDDANKGMEIFQQISGASSLTLTITRGGNEQILTPQF